MSSIENESKPRSERGRWSISPRRYAFPNCNWHCRDKRGTRVSKYCTRSLTQLFPFFFIPFDYVNENLELIYTSRRKRIRTRLRIDRIRSMFRHPFRSNSLVSRWMVTWIDCSRTIRIFSTNDSCEKSTRDVTNIPLYDEKSFEI